MTSPVLMVVDDDPGLVFLCHAPADRTRRRRKNWSAGPAIRVVTWRS